MLTLRSRFGCPKYTGHGVVVLLWSNFYCALLHIQVLVVYKAASLVTYGISAREKNQVRANVNLFFNCMKFKMDTWYLWLVSFPQEMNILEILEYFVYLFVFNAFLLLTDIFCWYLDLYVMSTGHCVCTGSALDSLCGRGRGEWLISLLSRGAHSFGIVKCSQSWCVIDNLLIFKLTALFTYLAHVDVTVG